MSINSSIRLKKILLPALFLIILSGGLFFWLRTRQPVENALPPSGTGKITLRETGMYVLQANDLKKMGLPTEPASLRLFNLGQPQSFWYSGKGDELKIYFYGQLLATPYTSENVYFLTTVENPPPQSLVPRPQTLISIPNPLHLEENALYFPKAEPERTWYWKSLSAPKNDPIEFTLSHLDTGEGKLRAAFFSSTESATITPDHHLRLLINNTLVVDQTWDGQGSQLIEAPLASGILLEGNNTLTIELPGDTGVVIETILLDWIEIQYPQLLQAENARLGFMGTGNPLELEGFRTLPVVFDLTPTGDGAGSPREVHPLDTLQFPTETDHLYLAVGPDGFLHPTVASAQRTPDLRIIQASYLALGPPDLLEPLQPLLTHRESQGISTLAVPIQAVYDQFGGGLPHPEAIRSYLQFASKNWDTPPQYLLLVGDSTYDLRAYQTSSEANRVPSFFIFTHYGGETASDVRFAQLDDDLLPDLIVGRLPARTPAQVSTVVEKTLAFENEINGTTNAADQAWTRRVLVIADGQEASFQTDAKTFLDYFPTGYESVFLTPPPGDTEAHTQITNALDEGVLFMSYFGHGSITMLGKDRIFSVEDGAALKNKATLPIMINITCLAGLFTHPEAESLTETMLWNPNGGAVAALSATSLTLPGDQAYLTQALIQALAQHPEATLGELLLLAQRQLPVENEGVREVMETFLLFGDPALVLP